MEWDVQDALLPMKDHDRCRGRKVSLLHTCQALSWDPYCHAKLISSLRYNNKVVRFVYIIFINYFCFKHILSAARHFVHIKIYNLLFQYQTCERKIFPSWANGEQAFQLPSRICWARLGRSWNYQIALDVAKYVQLDTLTIFWVMVVESDRWLLI